MTNKYPDFFARFYDVIYHQIRDGVDTDFFLKKIKQSKGKVLEIGVGTGRLFIQALHHGADIYGLDISESMINILKKKLSNDQFERISIQNIIDFRYDHKFDLIIAPFRVFMYLKEKNDQIKALNNIHKHLQSDGRFIFDTFIPDLKQLLNGIKNHTDFEGEYAPGKIVKRTVSTKPDLLNQIIYITFQFDWQENKQIKHEVWNTSLRYFFRFELEHIVERSNFNDYRIAGDYLENELNENSKDFIVICEKEKK